VLLTRVDNTLDLRRAGLRALPLRGSLAARGDDWAGIEKVLDRLDPKAADIPFARAVTQMNDVVPAQAAAALR
jgi:hypothetical protein